jgi:predicted Zn-dependent peptidase
VIRTSTVDGIPTLVAPTSGLTRAGLSFRVGQADETLARRGITHLLEHLVLHQVGATDYHVNGSTDDTVTQFRVQGSPDDVTAFLAGVCRSIRELDTDRMDRERAILRTEWSSRGVDATDAMPLWRHGARDYGLNSFPEWGLDGLTADDLREWAARWFTRDNAVLWIAGDDVPAQLALDLPAGGRRPAPVASTALPRTPAYFAGSSTTTAADMVVARSAAGGVFAGVLERQLFHALRRIAGVSYTVAAGLRPRDADVAVVTAVADALPDKQDAVLGGFVDVLAVLCAGQIDDAGVAGVVGRQVESLRTAESDATRLPSLAFDLLLGLPVVPSDALVDELTAVTAASVHAVAEAASESALLMIPRGLTADWTRFTAAPTASEHVVGGVAHVRLGTTGERLVIGAEGISRTRADGATTTVLFDECVALLAWPDGSRELIGADALSVLIEPTLYRHGDRLAVDERVPAGVRLEQPARDPRRIPVPWRRGLRGLVTRLLTRLRPHRLRARR